MAYGQVRICFAHRGFAHTWEDQCNVAQLLADPSDCRIKWRVVSKPEVEVAIVEADPTEGVRFDTSAEVSMDELPPNPAFHPENPPSYGAPSEVST